MPTFLILSYVLVQLAALWAWVRLSRSQTEIPLGTRIDHQGSSYVYVKNAGAEKLIAGQVAHWIRGSGESRWDVSNAPDA